LHWDGTRWAEIPSPNPGSSANLLNGVTALGSHDAWAVGEYDSGTLDQTLTLHWDGTAWAVVPSPNVGVLDNNFWDVAAVAPDDVWAIGASTSVNGLIAQTLTEHWDGLNWSVVPSPNLGPLSNVLYQVAAAAPDAVWAVGLTVTSITPARDQGLILRWDGTQWSAITYPAPGARDAVFFGVAARAPNHAWAVGGYSDTNGQGQTLVAHWDGGQWSTSPSPTDPLGTALFGVAPVSANEVWAVGEYAPGLHQATLTVHYVGICLPPSPTGTPPPVISTPTPRPAEPQEARLGVSLSLDPDSAIPPGGILTFTLSVRNEGPGPAFGSGVRLPLDRDLEVLDFLSTNPRIFVDYVGDDAVSVLFHDLDSGVEGTARIIARVRPTAQPGGRLTSRAVAYWADTHPHHTRAANSVTFTVGPRADRGQHGLQQPLLPAAGGPQAAGTPLTWYGAFFAEEEVISLWLTRPDRSTQAIDNPARSDQSGQAVVPLDTTGLTPGDYLLVAHGRSSGIEGVGAFTIK
jgi:hypothetical protein